MKHSGLSVSSFVLSVVSVLMIFLFFIIGIIMLHGQPLTNPRLPGTIMVGIGVFFGLTLQVLSIVLGGISIYSTKNNNNIIKWPAITGVVMSASFFSAIFLLEIVGLLTKH